MGHQTSPNKTMGKVLVTVCSFVFFFFLLATFSSDVLRLILGIFYLSLGPRGCHLSFILIFWRLKFSQLKFQNLHSSVLFPCLSFFIPHPVDSKTFNETLSPFLEFMIIWGIGIINFPSLWMSVRQIKPTQRGKCICYPDVWTPLRHIQPAFNQHASLGED